MVPALLHSLSDCQVPARLGRNEEGGEDRKSNPRDGGDRQSAGAAATKSHPALYLERILRGPFFKHGNNIDWEEIDVCSPHVHRIPCEMGVSSKHKLCGRSLSFPD